MHAYIYIFTIKDEEKGKDNNKISDGSTKKKTCFCANIFFSLSTNFLMNFFKLRIYVILLSLRLFGCQENKEN